MIKKPLLPSFSLAQRKEAKETSTYPHPLPIWRGSTAPPRRSFIKVSSPHQRGGLCFFSAYARSLGYSISRATAPPHPRATEILWYSHSTFHTPHSTSHISFLLRPSSFYRKNPSYAMPMFRLGSSLYGLFSLRRL